MTNTNNTRDDSSGLTRFSRTMIAIALMVLPIVALPLLQKSVNLGTAGDFVVLTKTGITTTGITSIVGDIGVSPAAATYMTGFGLIADPSNLFSRSSLVNGKIYAANYAVPTPAKMTAAVSDMETAYTSVAGRTSPDYTELYTGNVTGRTLTPGLYKWSTKVQVSAGGVTISGTAEDIWIFQIAQNLELASGAIVTLKGGALASNIFWQVAGQVTIGTTASMKGIILCKTAIVMNTGARLNGRALAQTAVTLDACSITGPAKAVAVKNSLALQKVASLPLAPVNLRTAGDYVIIAKTGVSATGITTIVGDVGVSPAPATYLTGFGLIADITNTFSVSSLVTGKLYAADNTDPAPAKLTAAVSDMETAYTDAAGRVTPDYTELYTGDLTGQTLTPGLYKWDTGVLISAGGLTISGTANDIWIFQIAQNLELTSGAIVTLSGGAQASNIFWQVAGQVTMGTTASMKGIILCQTAIVLNTGATLNGRALAQTAVTLDANSVVQSALVTSAKNVFTPQSNTNLLNNSNQSIEFVVSVGGRTTLTLLNPLGQKVVTLFSGEVAAGKYNKVQFNSNGLAKGLYFSELKFNGQVMRKKLLVK